MWCAEVGTPILFRDYSICLKLFKIIVAKKKSKSYYTTETALQVEWKTVNVVLFFVFFSFCNVSHELNRVVATRGFNLKASVGRNKNISVPLHVIRGDFRGFNSQVNGHNFNVVGLLKLPTYEALMQADCQKLVLHLI